jgi:ribosomal protein L37AE/L43A
MSEPFDTGASRPTHGDRMTPFHCPYCAEENLWPHEPEGWECRSCQRAFAVKFLGQLRPAVQS